MVVIARFPHAAYSGKNYERCACGGGAAGHDEVGAYGVAYVPQGVTVWVSV